MKDSLIILIAFFSISFVAYGQKKNNIVKVNSNINTLFKGDGFTFNRIGYERFINDKNSIGFWFGGNLKTSKLELGSEITTSSIANYTFMMDYYCYLYKHNNSGIYLSPAIFYENNWQSVDDDQQTSYGLNAGIGYRHTFKRVVVDCELFSTFEYLNQKNDIYTYRSKEIKPIDIKISVGYVF